MDRPSNKEIKAAIEKLKAKPTATPKPAEQNSSKLASKKTSKRIRKQGV